MKKAITALILFLLNGMLLSQSIDQWDLISSGGSLMKKDGLQLSWVVGQSANSIFSGDYGDIYQGFLQNTDWIIINEVSGDDSPLIEITVAPNPAFRRIVIQSNSETLLYAIVNNVLGQPIFNTTLRDQKTEIDMSNFPQGTYFIQVFDSEKRFIKTFKIQKIKL